MAVYHNILITLDCSDVDDTIVHHILSLAKSEQASVVLVHVVHSHTLDQDRILKGKADICIERHKQQFEAAAIPVTTKLLSGEPEIELVREIEAHRYDLVAMATHGHTYFSDLLLGSVSNHLKHHVKVPILMINSSL